MNTVPLHRDAWIEIHLDRIEENTRQLRNFLPDHVKLYGAVKANAYGYGDVESATMVLRGGADGLAVSILQEALRLRENGMKAPILILSPILPEDVDLAIQKDLTVTVFQASWLLRMKEFKTETRPVKVHLKIDTGLGRIGVASFQELKELWPLLTEKDILLEGMYTHFATANHEDSTFLKQQFEAFTHFMEWTRSQGCPLSLYHCCNTAAALTYPQAHLDLVRIGVGLFGIYPSQKIREQSQVKLTSALSFHTRVLHTKLLKEGSQIGYDRAYKAEEDQWIATIPVGYGDGWFRCFQGFHVLIDGERAPIIGKICMDQMMVRVSRPVAPGTLVTLIGRQGNLEITLEALADHIGSVPQEIPSMIGPRMPRIYYYRGEPVEVLLDRADQNLNLMTSKIEDIMLDLGKN